MKDDNSLGPKDKQIKDEITTLIKKREGTYKSALITTALSKVQGSWRSVFTKITLSNKKGDISEKLEYDDFILSKVSITVDEFLKILDDLILTGDLKIKNCPDVKATGTFEYDTYWRYRSSNDDWLKNEWPMHNYSFIIENQTHASPPSGPLISTKYPHFQDGQSAIKYYFGFNLQNYSSRIIILIPNYQLKVDKLTIGSEHLDLAITSNGIKQEDVIGKLYYEKEELIKTEDFTINENPKSIHIDFIPDVISIYLLKNDGEVLDFRRSYLKWPSSSKDISIEVKENDVLELIKQGENQRVEFKQELNKETERFAMTAVAFANGEGGTILFGVDDNANIKGVKEEIGDSLSKSLRSRCEPFIEHDIKTVTIEGEQIIVFRIEGGKNKPYILRDKGVYIRRGSSNRIANRMELNEFYDKKKTFETMGY